MICGSALVLIEEAVEFAAGRIEGALFLFRAVVHQWPPSAPTTSFPPPHGCYIFLKPSPERSFPPPSLRLLLQAHSWIRKDWDSLDIPTGMIATPNHLQAQAAGFQTCPVFLKITIWTRHRKNPETPNACAKTRLRSRLLARGQQEVPETTHECLRGNGAYSVRVHFRQAEVSNWEPCVRLRPSCWGCDCAK